MNPTKSAADTGLQKSNDTPSIAEQDWEDLEGAVPGVDAVPDPESDGELPEEDDDNPDQDSDEALPEDDAEEAIRRDLSGTGIRYKPE
ncbi:hypothetical protein [Mesorhizobium sp. BE184]|uniref:hypothetical protein n=1 Tax=Mesorhizobium sp. BE184 TaxID=2817714 RepID=UPI002866D602|nr:hypothetical protein [Mesorhizobium sp. BE184]MDR7031501.1 hypothetical protein [Mesorhizobium sp. BE184]